VPSMRLRTQPTTPSASPSAHRLAEPDALHAPVHPTGAA
jgi:hypothetical protein